MNDLTLPPVAKSIFYFCKKCDAERYHTVLSHASSISAKIQCEVCSSKKTYKITDPKKGKKATRKKASTKANTHKQLFDDCQQKYGTEGQSYTIKGSFENNAVLKHPKFGLGYVTDSKPDKIEVCFEDSARLLIHNRD